jgi:hypothetical protein
MSPILLAHHAASTRTLLPWGALSPGATTVVLLVCYCCGAPLSSRGDHGGAYGPVTAVGRPCLPGGYPRWYYWVCYQLPWGAPVSRGDHGGIGSLLLPVGRPLFQGF